MDMKVGTQQLVETSNLHYQLPASEEAPPSSNMNLVVAAKGTEEGSRAPAASSADAGKTPVGIPPLPPAYVSPGT